jgi:hypothetical protein
MPECKTPHFGEAFCFGMPLSIFIVNANYPYPAYRAAKLRSYLAALNVGVCFAYRQPARQRLYNLFDGFK